MMSLGETTETEIDKHLEEEEFGATGLFSSDETIAISTTNTNATLSSQTAQQNYVSGGSINVQDVVAGGTSGGYMAVAAAGASAAAAAVQQQQYNYNMQQQYYANQITNSNPQQLSTLISVYKASTYDQIRTVPVLSRFSDYDIQSHIKVLEERLQQMLQQQMMPPHNPQAKSSSIASAVGKGMHTLESSPAPATRTPALGDRLQQTKPALLSGKGGIKKTFVRYVKF